MEQQSINISYTPGNREPDCQIPLLYEITRFGELQTVNCTVNLKTNIPGWLQLRKFHITYRMHQGRCLALY
ncbi:MAG TPA: hypothetical protein VEB42_11385, partial [Chitinophagaceae bacterium]|nr:hypothetical protein [Chitinophagaceae bacterium]